MPSCCVRNKKPTPAPTRKISDILVNTAKLIQNSLEKYFRVKNKDFLQTPGTSIALSVQQPLQAWRFYFCRWLCAWGWVGQWHRVIKSSLHTASTQPHRQTRCGCCTSSEQGQTCPRTISPQPSELISNNCNYRHKTTVCKNCLV